MKYRSLGYKLLVIYFFIKAFCLSNCSQFQGSEIEQRVFEFEYYKITYDLKDSILNAIIYNNDSLISLGWALSKRDLKLMKGFSMAEIERKDSLQHLHDKLNRLYNIYFSNIKTHIPISSYLAFQIEESTANIPFALLYDNENYLIENYYPFMVMKDIGTENEVNIRIDSYENNEYYLEKYSDQYGRILRNALGIKSATVLSEKSNLKIVKSAFDNSSSIYISTHGVLNEEGYFLEFNNSLHDFETVKTQDEINLLFINACYSATHCIKNASEINLSSKYFIGSLWENSSTDRATANVVKRFFANREKGNMILESLILAQRETLNREELSNMDSSDIYRKGGHHPFYWAPFVLII